MTSDPLTSPNGNPLPPKHRPNLENLSKDTTESDLWALDDLDASSLKPAGRAGFRTGSNLPTLRPGQKAEADGGAGLYVSEPGAVDKFRPTGLAPKVVLGDRGTVVNDLLDLGTLQSADELDDSQPGVIAMPAPKAAAAAKVALEEKEEPPASEFKSFNDELKDASTSSSKNIPRKPKTFTTTDWIGLAVLFVLLAGAGAFAFSKSIAKLPTKSIYDHDLKFPIKGQHLNLTAATSYWRAPNTHGASNESVRAGTVLIPVLELTSSSGPAAVRVMYRDENDKIIGDIVSRSIVSGQKIVIPATAGFDDRGLHAAYRAGQAKRWTIEILEASSEKASSSEFKKLIEFPVSTELR
jgi:hypothetical protein